MKCHDVNDLVNRKIKRLRILTLFISTLSSVMRVKSWIWEECLLVGSKRPDSITVDQDSSFHRCSLDVRNLASIGRENWLEGIDKTEDVCWIMADWILAHTVRSWVKQASLYERHPVLKPLPVQPISVIRRILSLTWCTHREKSSLSIQPWQKRHRSADTKIFVNLFFGDRDDRWVSEWICSNRETNLY